LLIAGLSSIAHSTTIVTNAQIYTMNTATPWAESFVYDDNGKIVAVGDESNLLARFGDSATIIDAHGNMILPGFQDVHVHVPEAGINESLCLLPASRSLSAYSKLIRGCAARQPNERWVRAAGVSLFELRDSDILPIDVLDQVMPDRPVLILDDLGHAVWTNTAGLRAAGIDPDAPDPQGGVLHRDARGRLTGLLLEDAQQRVRNAAAPAKDVVCQGLLAAFDELARNGITAISDAGGYWMQQHPLAWERAVTEGTISVRAANALYLYPSLDFDRQLSMFERRFDNDGDDLLRFDTAKIYIDGILDLGTAATLQPYDQPLDDNYRRGFNYFVDNQLHEYVNRLHALGYRMNFHVIGDRAVREALDAIEAIDDSADNIAARRHRTTHTYMVDAADIDRFAALGVVADLQVGVSSTDPGYHDYLADFIGQRAYSLLPLRQLHAAGAVVTLSSDWDADPLSPLSTIQQALTRESNALDDLHSAIGMVTLQAAYALGHDDLTGSIEPGKYADFVVLDQNLFDVSPQDIDSVQVLMTVLAGEVIWADQ
jgi:predicted amidohydrolase YtcJ